MRNILLSVNIKYNEHHALLIYIDGHGYALRDIETNDIYYSVHEFRDAYQPNAHLRNGHQINNIAIILDNEFIGRYSEYKPLQNIHSMVCINYPDDPESIYIRSLYDLGTCDLVDLVLKKDKEIQEQVAIISAQESRIAELEALLLQKND